MRVRSPALALLGFTLVFPARIRAGDVSPRVGALQTLLGVPPEMAQVKDSYVPHGQKFLHYVLIEDAHESPEAQGKIAAILLYAHHHWGSRQAFIEGAFGPIGPPPFPIFTPERGERSITELLRDGLFSAGELAAALASQLPENSARRLLVKGMDDPFLYRQQLEAFEDLASLRDRALWELRQFPVTPAEKEDLRTLINLRMSPTSYHQYLCTRRQLAGGSTLAWAINRAEVYYRLTERRSRAFAETVRERLGNAPSLLVMGGFHTPVITGILKERGESFIVLSPHLTQKGRPDLYQHCLARTFQSLQTFPYTSPYFSSIKSLRLSLNRQVD